MAIVRPRPRTVIGAGIATSVDASLVVLAPAAADVPDAAAPEITNSTKSIETPLSRYDYVGMTARWDLSDADSEVADGLRLELPPEFTHDVYDFPLVIDENTTLGTCVTTPPSGDIAASMVCTLKNEATSLSMTTSGPPPKHPCRRGSEPPRNPSASPPNAR